jgi:hypothetical protein
MPGCATPLDPTLDPELVELNQRATKMLPAFFVDLRLDLDEDGMPVDPLRLWLAYLSALVYSNADASLICIAHNRSRESRVLERQIFECMKKAEFYVANPEEARLEFLAWPYRQKKLLDDLHFDKQSPRFVSVEKAIATVSNKYPEVAAHAAKYNNKERPFREMVGDANDDAALAEYAFHYRRPSQTPHGSVTGMEDVLDFRPDGYVGVKFDSRLDDANASLHLATIYVINVLDLLNKCLGLTRDAEVDALWKSSNALLARMHPDEHADVNKE